MRQQTLTSAQITTLIEAIALDHQRDNSSPGQPHAEYEQELERVQLASALVSACQRQLAEIVSELRAQTDRQHIVRAEHDEDGSVRFVERERLAHDRSNRRYGWQVIGAALGVTAQAAQARFGTQG